MECESAPSNASSIAESVSIEHCHFHLIRAEFGVKCEHGRFEMQAVTRSDRITGRDIFDFALIAEREPDQLMAEKEFMIRHAEAVFQQLETRYEPLKKQFDAVDVIDYRPDFDQACTTLTSSLRTMLLAVQSELLTDGEQEEDD